MQIVTGYQQESNIVISAETTPVAVIVPLEPVIWKVESVELSLTQRDVTNQLHNFNILPGTVAINSG